MKKFLYMALVSTLALASCEDVPAPYEIFSDGSSVNPGDQPTTQLEGDGSAANPYNVAAILEYVKSLDADVNSPNEIYFKGKVSSVKEISPSYNNASFYISDDGSTKNEFYVYRCLGVNKEKITTEDLVKKGDEVVMCGKVVNYKGNTPETVQKEAYIVTINGSGSSVTPPTPDVPVTGAGSKSEPYNVGSAQQNSGKSAWVEGYIVGYVDGQVYASGATFAVPAAAETEIILADAADVKDAALCIPVQLPVGDIHSGLELFANPTLLGQKVKLYGSLEKYFGVTGLKSTSCAILGDKVIGKDPESTEPDQPVGDIKGTGTASDPYNVAGVLSYTKALQADVNSTSEIYFKGIVSSVKEISPVGNYNNATFYISDDGKAANEFYIFRCLGLNKADIQSADLVKVGDEVLICGKVVNYKGNTPETVQKEAWIVSINGNGETPDTPVDPTPVDPVDPTPDTPADPNQLVQNGDFELWTNGVPDNWKTTSTAGNAKLEQSTNAHGGKYAVQVNGTTANQRLGYKETVYAAGTYVVKFYAKALGGATSSYGPQCRPGFVPVVDGKVGNYVYGDYATLSETDWMEVTYSFTLTEQTTLCLVVMNAKNSGNILIDDFSISKQ